MTAIHGLSSGSRARGVNRQGARCETRTAVPLTRTSPSRVAVPSLGATRNSTLPVPCPEAGDNPEIHVTRARDIPPAFRLGRHRQRRRPTVASIIGGSRVIPDTSPWVWTGGDGGGCSQPPVAKATPERELAGLHLRRRTTKSAMRFNPGLRRWPDEQRHSIDNEW